MANVGIISLSDSEQTDEDLTDTESFYSDETSYEGYLSAQKQWEESIGQLKSILYLVLFPVVGRLIGRKFTYMLWKRFANWWFM